MDFTLDDIKNLYGDFIYIIPEAGQIKQPAKPAVEKKEAPVVQETAPEELPEKSPKEKAAPTPKTPEAAAPGITWKPKENSKVLFVLHPDEFKNKKLTNLLKDIVAAMKIPFEDAGFGTIEGPVGPSDWKSMPNPYAVIFDLELNRSGENPLLVGDKKIYFSGTLAELESNRTMKRELWNHLQSIMNEM